MLMMNTRSLVVSVHLLRIHHCKIRENLQRHILKLHVHLLRWFRLEYYELNIGRQIISIHFIDEDHLEPG